MILSRVCSIFLLLLGYTSSFELWVGCQDLRPTSSVVLWVTNATAPWADGLSVGFPAVYNNASDMCQLAFNAGLRLAGGVHASLETMQRQLFDHDNAGDDMFHEVCACSAARVDIGHSFNNSVGGARDCCYRRIVASSLIMLHLLLTLQNHLSGTVHCAHAQLTMRLVLVLSCLSPVASMSCFRRFGLIEDDSSGVAFPYEQLAVKATTHYDAWLQYDNYLQRAVSLARFVVPPSVSAVPLVAQIGYHFV